MLIYDIFDIPEISCIEPVFADLTDDYYSDELLSIPTEEARLLIDENEFPIALALREKKILVSRQFCMPNSFTSSHIKI